MVRPSERHGWVRGPALIRAALWAVLIFAFANEPALANEFDQARLTTVMDGVFGAGNWRLTGGYRSQERENQLRAQGAMTVRPGAVSRHSMGRPGAPGAYDVVVEGMNPWQAAARLRAAGAPFANYVPKGAHGTQGPHLHLEPFAHGRMGRAARQPVAPWVVAERTAAEESISQMRAQAACGSPHAELELGRAYAQGAVIGRDLIAAYVWTARAATNDSASAETRASASRTLALLTGKMKRDELAYAVRFDAFHYGAAVNLGCETGPEGLAGLQSALPPSAGAVSGIRRAQPATTLLRVASSTQPTSAAPRRP